MAEHPISSLMDTAMHSIKEMIDVNTIVGDAVNTSDGGVIIPISKVSFGFAAGGGEYSGKIVSNKENAENQPNTYPFAGGSGAGVSITPVAFMVVHGEECRLMPANTNCSVDRIVEMIPSLLQKVENLMTQKLSKNDNTNKNFEDEEFQNQTTSEGPQNQTTSAQPQKQTKKATTSQETRPLNNYQSYPKSDAGSDPDFLPPN